MTRELSQREYDRQMIFSNNFEKASLQFSRDMKELARLVREYPDQTRKLLRKREA